MCYRKIRFIASIIIWAKRRCRTSWSSASTTRFSSPSGTGVISIMCKSPMRRRWGRSGGYFGTAGTLRDMVPNHVMQLLSLTAMESPVSFQADAVRNEQAKVLHAIQPLSSDDVLRSSVRGQYGAGLSGEEKVSAYRAEPGVSPESRTETFVALKINIDNWRWAGVPFYFRPGKG